ncbi:TonB-dependent hemoglobin/transferrin/lactoferrin family receptor [Salinisphaera orenii]|uniref:TonB-dependent hemoglobin/transferrin/lactoferrin family receptor n=1 Tax=Salinisphaera orenii TaxID=856731 RepID=UPI0013A637CF
MRIRQAGKMGLVTFLLFASTAAWPQNDGDSTSGSSLGSEGPAGLQLVPIDVVGGGFDDADEQILNAPFSTRTDRAELEQDSVESLEDIDRRLGAGVNFSGASDSINIRGLGRNRVTTRIDGVRVPWTGGGARDVQGGIASFGFNSLASFNVVRGADSSRYGSGTLGGAVDIQTLDPEDLLEDDEHWAGQAELGTFGVDQSGRGSVAIAGQVGDTLGLIQVGYRRGDERDNQGEVGGLGADRTQPNPRDYDQWNVLAKLHQYLGDAQRVTLTGVWFDRDTDINVLTGQGPDSQYKTGRHDGEENVERKRVVLGYDYAPTSGSGWLDGAHAKLFWQRQTLETGDSGIRTPDPRANIIPGDPFDYGPPSGVYRVNNQIEVTDWGAKGSVKRAFDGGPIHHVVTLGGRFDRQETEQYTSGRSNCPASLPSGPFGPQTCKFLHNNQADQPSVEGRDIGAYLRDRLSFGDSGVRVTPALRFDYYDRDPQRTSGLVNNPNRDGSRPSQESSQFSPSVLLEWDVASQATLYARYARGFRAPSAQELYLDYGGPGTYLVAGNADLKPETSNGFELGAELGDKALGATVSVFDNYYDDYIDQVEVDPSAVDAAPGRYPFFIRKTVNRAKVRIYGGEARAHWQIARRWRVAGSLAYYRGEDTRRNEPINSVPPAKATLSLRYDAKQWGVNGFVTAAAERDRVADPETDFQAPAYAVVDLTGWWQPGIDGLRLRAGVFNLFDKTYYNALDVPDTRNQPDRFYSKPGRNFRLSLNYRF